jgi:dipeptidyl aminopeptidase/acylaminoacyl peptidase
MRPREAITVTARDGLRLHGFVTKPAAAGPHPMIVMPHDGPTGRDSWLFDADAQLLANRGYAVLQINYRGSRGYGTEFEAAGYQKWGTAIQDDIADATRWAIEQKIADPARVCIFGTGFGGYSALMNAAREPKLYRCAISNAGMFDLAATLAAPRLTDSARNRLERTMGADPALLRSQSPLYQAERVEAAVLLIQRKYATDVYADQAKDMYEKLQRANKRVELFEPVGEEGAEMNRTRFERVLAFLEQQLK